MQTLSQLSKQDLEAIYAFDILCFPKDSTNKETWIEIVNDPRTTIYAIKNHQEIIASISIYNWKGEQDYVKIMFLSSHPNHRNKGLGTRLLNTALMKCSKKVCTPLKAKPALAISRCKDSLSS